jgi:hypothetical protein
MFEAVAHMPSATLRVTACRPHRRNRTRTSNQLQGGIWDSEFLQAPEQVIDQQRLGEYHGRTSRQDPIAIPYSREVQERQNWQWS